MSALPVRVHHTAAAATKICSAGDVGSGMCRHGSLTGRADSCCGSCKGVERAAAAEKLPAAHALDGSVAATCDLVASHPGQPAERDAVCAICLEEYADGDKVGDVVWTEVRV